MSKEFSVGVSRVQAINNIPSARHAGRQANALVAS